MSYKILSNIKYGKGSLIFKLKKGDTASDDLFERKDIPRLLKFHLIELSDSSLISEIKTSKVKEIPDISELTANEIRDLLEGINDLVTIEKMIDKESLIHPPRKNVLPLLTKRSKELSIKA